MSTIEATIPTLMQSPEPSRKVSIACSATASSRPERPESAAVSPMTRRKSSMKPMGMSSTTSIVGFLKRSARSLPARAPTLRSVAFI